MKIITKSVEETIELGKFLGECINEEICICLDGELGAGKTHFTKGLAEGLEADDEITSPTFTIVQEYGAKIPLAHFDFYRISDENELYDMGFEDYLRKKMVLIIEWSHNVLSVLPQDRLDIIIEYGNDECFRDINFNATGIKSQELLKKLSSRRKM